MTLITDAQKTRVLKILLVIIIAITGYISYTITKAIEFRKNQKNSFTYFKKQFSNSGIDNLIARLLIIQEGSPEYEVTKNLLLRSIKPIEDTLNIHIYNKLYQKMNEEDFVTSIINYPFDINKLPEKTILKLTSNKGCRLLDIELNKSNQIYETKNYYDNTSNEKSDSEDTYIPQNTQQDLTDKIIGFFKEDIDTKIKTNNNYKKNVLIDEISTSGTFASTELIKIIQSISSDEFHKKIINCISERHLQKEALRDNQYHCLEKNTRSNQADECKYIESTKNGSYDYSFDLMYYILPIENKGSEKRLVELINSKGKIPATLVANYLKSNIKAEKELIKSYIDKYFSLFNKFDLVIISYLLRSHPNELEYLVKLTEERNENFAIHVFNQIVNDNIEYAETIFNKRSKRKDSVLKKAMIALLIKNESLVASKYINEIFTGSSPRVIRLSQENYLYSGSKPLEEYIKISTHDYLQTGKVFPPAYCNSPPPNEVKLWENYIERYPWFPSTDDAYYRLIYRLILDGEIQKATTLIKKYEDSIFSDTDVDHFIQKMKIKIYKNDYSSFKLNITSCKTE